MRVYELAKELDLSGKELLSFMGEIGLNINNHLKGLEPEEVSRIKESYDKMRSKDNEEVKSTNKNVKESGAEERSGKKITVIINKNQEGDISSRKISIEETKEDKVSKPDEKDIKAKSAKEEKTEKLVIRKDSEKKPEPKEKESEETEKPKSQRNDSGASKNFGEQKKPDKKRSFENKKFDGKKNYEREQNDKKPGGQNKSGNFKKNFDTNNKDRNDNKGGNRGGKPFGANDKKPDFKNDNKQNFKGKKPFKKEEPEEILPEKPRRNYKQNARKKDAYRKEAENEVFKNKAEKKFEKAKPANKPEPKDEIKLIRIEDGIIVKEFAEKLGVSPSKVIQKLIMLGIMASQNEVIDFDAAQLVGEEFNAIVELEKPEEVKPVNIEEEFKLDYEDKEEHLQMRWPIVTVMGHVDHGKTSLLDAIKSTNITSGEAGGITQHIGAYLVNVGSKKICFIDTPGHEAFTAMRARGAQITDIAILVVAADDGVMPQTIEAINHAKAAKVPIVVAINKIDKDGANVEKIKQELVEQGLVSEEWGGDVIMVPVSAKKKVGIEELLEMVLLVSEMQNLRANPDRTAVGTVIEAELDKHQGAKATVLISKGTLKVGDMIVSGSSYGKVRSMLDDKGKNLKKAGPSTPVVIFGLSAVPNAGDSIYSTKNDKQAKNAAQMVNDMEKAEMIRASKKVSLDDLFEQIKLGEVKDLNIIVKADGKGSIEALKNSLSKMQTDEVKANVIHEGVGGITESDVILASASNAIIVGFNVRPNSNAIENAKREDVDIRTYRVIYDAIDDIRSAIIGMHSPKLVEEIIGHAVVRNVFSLPNGQKIAGIYVQTGKITRQAKIRLIRDDVVITEKNISSLRRFKDDVKEVQSGYEAGLGIENYNDIKNEDEIEVFIDKEVEVKDLDI